MIHYKIYLFIQLSKVFLKFVIPIALLRFIGVQYRYFYRQITVIQDKMGLDDLPPLLNDLVIIRIFEPASKLRSMELMERFFGIKHSRKSYYRIAPQCIELKETVENRVVAFAKEHYSFDFDIVFYDVTTLYFETFEEDNLRKNGFSKDNKSQQPQILVALMVTKEGFQLMRYSAAIHLKDIPLFRSSKILSAGIR